MDDFDSCDQSLNVVYFTQQTVASHAIHWLKSSFWPFNIFFHPKQKKIENVQKQKRKKNYMENEKRIYQGLNAKIYSFKQNMFNLPITFW